MPGSVGATLTPLSIMGMLVPFLAIGLTMAGGALLWGYWKGKQVETEASDGPGGVEADPADIDGGDA